MGLISEGRIHICAELGTNHSGSLETACQLIDAAKAAGADSVKFQKRATGLIPESVAGQMRQTPWGYISYQEYKERIEFSVDDYRCLQAHADRVGIPMWWSVWDISSLVAIKENFEPFAYKVPSARLTDHDLLKALKARTVPIVLSTGMSTVEQVDDAVNILFDQGNEIVVVHCNSTYPCPPADLNLKAIRSMQVRYAPLSVGYSCHATGLAPSVAAAGMGIVFLEKHLTLDRSSWGTDQAASVEPQGFRRLVKDVRLVEAALGDGVKRVTDGEQEAMVRLRG